MKAKPLPYAISRPVTFHNHYQIRMTQRCQPFAAQAGGAVLAICAHAGLLCVRFLRRPTTVPGAACLCACSSGGTGCMLT